MSRFSVGRVGAEWSWVLACAVYAVIGCAPATADDSADTPPPGAIEWHDRSPAWGESAPKLLLTGTIYQPDGRTPAAGVVLYYYHTNAAGRYEHRPGEPRSMPPNEKGHTHGYIRGWVKSSPDGRYAIYTTRPGAYPGGAEPVHVHVTVLEPNGAAYYLDDFFFDDDPTLTEQKRRRLQNRGGSGVVKLVARDELSVGERNIVLGQNVPGYARPTTAPAR